MYIVSKYIVYVYIYIYMVYMCVCIGCLCAFVLLVDVLVEAIADSRATILFLRILSTAFARRLPCSCVHTCVPPYINDVEAILISISDVARLRPSSQRECRLYSSRCFGRLYCAARGEERANKRVYDAQVCGGVYAESPSWKWHRCRDRFLREGYRHARTCQLSKC